MTVRIIISWYQIVVYYSVNALSVQLDRLCMLVLIVYLNNLDFKEFLQANNLLHLMDRAEQITSEKINLEVMKRRNRNTVKFQSMTG